MIASYAISHRVVITPMTVVAAALPKKKSSTCQKVRGIKKKENATGMGLPMHPLKKR